ncbi:MAG TPA: peptide-N-glycosidase F-related protein [Polyangiaceae bacterium]|nr:peptide-N-glycosidase F-related protein [Polyangiaceae bacterium]
MRDSLLVRLPLLALLALVACSSGNSGNATDDSGADAGDSGGGASTGGSSSSGGAGLGGGVGGELEPSYYDFSNGDMRGYVADGDFSPRRYKGECAAGEVMTGLSLDHECVSPRILQCAAGHSWSAPEAVVRPNCGDDRRDATTGDWDNGYRKGECAANEAVVGVSRDTEGALYDLVCADASVASAGACTVRNVNAGDNRANTTTGDWDPSSFKAECAAGEYVKGVSLDVATRHPHAILCCSGEGETSVVRVDTDESQAPAACNRSGVDTSLTIFDKAHMTGSARYLYKTVDFPEAGTYEKITLTFTLACPQGGCDPWDRWGNIGIVQQKKAGDPGGDQMLELGRFVTPYGVGGTFTYDLTDVRPALVGNEELRVFIDTWVDGWLVTAKIEMKGGQPAKEPTLVLPLWSAPQVRVGNPSRSVSNDAPAREVTLPSSVCGLSVRATVTGHGQGNRDNCAEFCPKKHYFEVEGASHERTVWRTDCATTAVQNQNGTWQYSRAGWCPGASVRELWMDATANVGAPAKAAMESISVAYDVESYDNTCRPDNCNQNSCVFDTSCDYDGGAHTEPFYALTAVLVGYR